MYKPWRGDDGLPQSTTWKAFCDWMEGLKICDSILSRARFAFVQHAAHNLKYISQVSKILKWYRGSNATRWLSMPAHKRPSAWMFGDEGAQEANLPNKASERESALAMQELLHKISFASVAETKKSQLMQSTLQAYKNAIDISLQSSSGISMLHGESVPVLVDRINPFAYNTLNTVREQNIMKMSDQLLIQRQKRKRFKRGATMRPRSPSPDIQDPDISWSPQQSNIISAVTRFLEQFTQWKAGHCLPPASLSMLIFGGPGVGKTTVLKAISRLCEQASMPLLSSAATGVAAGAMHKAGTNHSKFCIPVFGKGESDTNHFLPPLSQKTVDILMQDFQASLENGTPLAIAVDECSMLSALQFGRILRRVEEFEKAYFSSTTEKPPRLFILVGDFYQVAQSFLLYSTFTI